MPLNNEWSQTVGECNAIYWKQSLKSKAFQNAVALLRNYRGNSNCNSELYNNRKSSFVKVNNENQWAETIQQQ